MAGKKNANVSSNGGSVSDQAFMEAIGAHLKNGDRVKALEAAAKMGIDENYFNSRLSRIRTEAKAQGVIVPTFKRGRATSKDPAALASVLKGMFSAAE